MWEFENVAVGTRRRSVRSQRGILKMWRCEKCGGRYATLERQIAGGNLKMRRSVRDAGASDRRKI
jgi:hypothetical protein